MSNDSKSTTSSRDRIAYLVAAGFLLFSLVDVSEAREWHVFPDSTGDAPFLQAAVDSASDGDVIHLAAGVHSGDNVVVRQKGLTIYGDGPDSYAPSINFIGDRAPVHAVIRDMSFVGHDDGAVGFQEMSSGTVERCVIVNTEYGVDYWAVKDVTVRDCLFQNNHNPANCGVSPSGGAISINDGGFGERYLIENCTFIGNSSSNCGLGSGAGAISIQTSEQNSTEITRCLFVGNFCPTGGAIALFEGNTDIHHNIFVANEAQDAVIVEAFFGEGRVFGNVFARNRTSGIWSTTIGFQCGCNLFWRNESPDPRQFLGECDLFSGYLPNAILDPLFCGWRAGDYTVGEMSPTVLLNLPEEMQGICDEGINLGAVEVGCSIVPTIQTSWGRLKNRFADEKE
jgi:hypothetical protein